jgi:ketosteroid isomerase-like protein
VSQADVDVTQQFLKAFSSGDIQGVFALVHPEIVVDEGAGLPYEGEFVGPEGLQDLIGKIMSKSEMVVDSFDVSDGGDCAVARLQLIFTARGSGRVVTMPSIELYETKDGKVSKIDVFYKSTQTMADLFAG